MKKSKPNVERLMSFLFLLITLGVVLYVGFSGNDLEALGGALRTMSPAYLALCLLCSAFSVVGLWSVGVSQLGGSANKASVQFIASLLGLYFFAGFGFEKGRPALAVLCSMLGVYFSIVMRLHPQENRISYP